MNRNRRVYPGMVAALVLVSTTLIAQGPGNGGRNYDPKSEVKLSGTIDDIQQHAGRHGWMGIHLMLKTDTGTVEVHVGPAAYVSEQKLTFAKGDTIEVLGSKVKLNTGDAVLAREITKEGKTVAFRDAQGIPLWSRNRPR